MADQTLIAWTDHTFNPWMGAARRYRRDAKIAMRRPSRRTAWGWMYGGRTPPDRLQKHLGKT